jgi:abhydrolase domain-containing protein 13
MSYYMNNVISALRLSIIGSSGVAVLLSGLLYFKQNEIIYPRNVPTNARSVVPQPEEFRIPAHCSEEAYINTPDGEKLHSFLVRPANPARGAERNITILMFHGNAGNIGYRLPIARVLHDELACNVLMVQYRGYGLSSGKPDEKGLNIDAQASLDYIRNHYDLESTKVIVYGQSLGGAVGANLVEKDLRIARQEGKESQIAALILENTFLSIKKMIPAYFP